MKPQKIFKLYLKITIKYILLINSSYSKYTLKSQHHIYNQQERQVPGVVHRGGLSLLSPFVQRP